MEREPVLTIGAVTALVAAILALLIAFGIEVSDVQAQAILAVIAAAGPIVAALLARRRVTPERRR